MISVNIDCQDAEIRKGLLDLNNEILLIGKSSSINFDEAPRSLSGRTFKFELSNKCALSVNFQVRFKNNNQIYLKFNLLFWKQQINISLEIDRLNNQIKKHQNDMNKIQEKISKDNYATKTSAENMEKDQRLVKGFMKIFR